jgi:hypothetical protein
VIDVSRDAVRFDFRIVVKRRCKFEELLFIVTMEYIDGA